MRSLSFLLWLLVTCLQLWSSWPLVAFAQQAQSFFPPAVPLAVRSPTFNCWLDTRNASNPMTNWPTFWNDQHILGWAGLIKVDGETFHWLGSPTVGNASTWLGATVTPTRTILTVQAGPMLLNVTFLSPVEPADWTRQSFPFSYMYIDGQATDGHSHSIQLYSDISGEWVTNSLSTPISFETTTVGNTRYHQVQSSTPSSTFQDVAEDSIAYYAVDTSQTGLVSVIGNDQTLRPQFAAPGSGFTLSIDIAGTFGNVRASNGKFPVLAHAVDLGITNSISSVAWAVGLVRDPVVTYLGSDRRLYFWSQYANISTAIDTFVQDFTQARNRALALEQQILQDASAVSPAYADLVSLATRQVMAGVEITLPTQLADGSWNFSDVQAFMKDVGGTQRVNPTEMVYAALPALLYLNSSLAGALLEPMLHYQASPDYTNPFAAPDLGLAYPSAAGDSANDNSVYGVENSGDMLILALAHARTSGDGSLLGKYYSVLKSWTDYLVSNALIPTNQNSADARDSTLAQNHGNVTNLAIKGIIAIQAMSEISDLVGQTADSQLYAANATSFVQSWINLTSSGGSLLSTYHTPTSGGLMYNLFADRLLQLNLLPSSIYTQESTTLGNLNVQGTFGLTLNTESNGNTRSDWTLFSAAAAPDNTTRDLLINGVYKRASDNATQGPFSNIYNVQTAQGEAAGTYPNGFASPAQGAMFSLLSLNVPNKTVIVSQQQPGGPSPGGSSKHGANSGAIAGGVIAGAFAVFVIGVLVVFVRRGRQRSAAEKAIAVPQAYGRSGSQPALMTELSSPTTDSQGGVAPSAFVLEPKFRGKHRGPPQSEELVSEPFSSPPASQAPTWVSGVMTSTSRATASESGSRTAELRNEMEVLRREVEQLRAERNLVMDAPPEYR